MAGMAGTFSTECHDRHCAYTDCALRDSSSTVHTKVYQGGAATVGGHMTASSGPEDTLLIQGFASNQIPSSR